MNNGLVQQSPFAPLAENLAALAEDQQLMEIARQAIESALVARRDARLSETFRGNGLVIREAHGAESSVIRFGPEEAMHIGLRAIAEHLQDIRQ